MPVKGDLVETTEFAHVYDWAKTRIRRLHTCPACGQPLGSPSEHPENEPVDRHIGKHDPDDFPVRR